MGNNIRNDDDHGVGESMDPLSQPNAVLKQIVDASKEANRELESKTETGS